MTNDDTRLVCRWGVGRVVIVFESYRQGYFLSPLLTEKTHSIIFDVSRQTLIFPFVYKGFSFDYGC